MFVTCPLTSGIKRLDMMLGGFETGKLIILEGDLSASSLSHLLCVRSQLPVERGGFDSPVIWLDGGNTFNIYSIIEISRGLGLDPERVLRSIYLSRAFTCHQMSSLVLEKLWDAVKRFESKLVLISDLPRLYLESDIPREEAVKVFVPVVDELRNSPNRKDVLIRATSLEYPFVDGKNQVSEILASNADFILRTRQRSGGVEVELEKHSSKKAKKFVLGAEVLGVVPLDEFAGGGGGWVGPFRHSGPLSRMR
jgi:hypothetical protein